MSWHRKHLLDIESLSAEEITTVLDTAREFKAVGQRDIKKVPALQGKTVVLNFLYTRCKEACPLHMNLIRQLQSSVDEGLAEIAAENPEILSYFDSPYSRLALIWSGALMSSLKKRRYFKNVHPMGPGTNRRASAPRASGGGSTEVRKEHGSDAPRVPNVLSV